MNSGYDKGDSAYVGPVFYLPKRIVPLEEERLLFTVNGTPLSHTILLITEGTGRLRLDGVEKTVRRGSVALCENDVFVRMGGFVRGWLIEYQAYGDAAELGKQEHSLFITRRLDVYSPRMIRNAEELANSWHSRLAQTAFRSQRIFLELVELLQAECQSSQGTDADNWLPRILHALHERYAEEWTRQQIAELAGISEEHFSRSFRRKTGYTFIGYLTLLRIREVQRGLLLDEGSVQDLAIRAGYRDGSDLSRAFKRIVGQSPLSYKQSEKRIVTYNFNYTACMLALGLQPVRGAYSGWMMQTHECLPLDQRSEFNVYGPEECRRIVEASEPDVVIGYDHLNEEHEWLTVAPVIGISFMEMDWREQFRQVAMIAQRPEEAEKLLAGYERKVRHANKRLDMLGLNRKRGTAIIWEIGSNGAYTFGTRFGRGGHIVYGDLDFQFPEHFPTEEVAQYGYFEVPFDHLRKYPADYIFIIGANHDERERVYKWFEQADGSRIGKLYLLGSLDLFYGFDPLSTMRQLEVIQEVLTQNVDAQEL